ncbi:kelch-like protein 3 [Montipora foliosa]|uniref:kelch-like protein 3 n=1 Tax=Montipora foliosa TaxID=591990 RepID=UPI0035F1AD08
MAAVMEAISAQPSQHCHELIARLDALRESRRFCDVTVAVKGEEFKAHKIVLAAASPFFLSLFETNMRESNENLVKIELEETAAFIMGDVLKYIYTGCVSVIEETAHNLIATADYLLLPGLKTLACEFVMSNVTSEGCLFNYLFADKYQCPELKKKSCEMMKLNFSVVMETEDFLKLDVDQVMEWVSSDDVIVRAEEDVFRGIMNWVAYSKVEREKYLPDLLHQIRVSSMSHSFLLNELVEEELIKTNHVFLNFVVDSQRGILNTDQEQIGKHPRKCLDTQSDVIFVCGGRKCSCYLPDQDLWSQLPDMIFDSKNQPCVQFRDKIYTFNNQNSKTGQAKVAQYYLSSSNAWVAIQTRLPAEGEEFSSLTTLNGKIYGTGRFSGILFEYDPSKNEWAVKTPAMGLWGCCGVSDGKHIYVVGGTLHEPREHTIGSFKVERFDPNLNKWEEAAAMNEARHNAFGAAMNGKMYVAGGIAANLSEIRNS